jgi:hypothetical protein
MSAHYSQTARELNAGSPCLFREEEVANVLAPRRAILLGLLGLTCAGPLGCHRRRPHVIGEVHVHQFEGGSHPAAFFVGKPRPLPAAPTDTLVPDPAPVDSEGRCALYLPVPPSSELVPVDAGPVAITGGQLLPRINLALSAAGRAYLPDESFKMGMPVFAGGELLTYEGGGSAGETLRRRFRGTLRAPMPLELLAPSGRITTRDLAIRWKPGTAERVLATLIVSRQDGTASIIKCSSEDAAGQLVIPPRLIRGLVAPPRDLQLEVRRDAISQAPSEGGAVILHASWAVVRLGSE